MSKIHLLLGITLSDLGGAQRVVQEIIAGLPEEDYSITLVTSVGGPLVDWARAYAKDRDLEVIELPSSRREISPLDDLKLFFRLRRLIKEKRFDIAHFHSSKMGFIGRLAARTAGNCKILYTAHGWGTNSKFQPPLARIVFDLAEKIAGRCSDRVICVAETDRILGEARGWIPKGRGLTIRNGLPDTSFHQRTGKLRHELGISERTPIIGTVARLTRAKAPELLLRIAAKLAQTGMDFALVVIGDGPLFAETQAMAKKPGLKGRAHLLGRRTDVAELLPDFDLFVLLSRWEGLPLSVIEAMFAGLPVVASDVGGVRELVEDGVTGLLVPPMAESAALAAVERLLSSPALRQRMGEAGRARAKEEFTVERMVLAHDGLYKSLITPRPPPYSEPGERGTEGPGVIFCRSYPRATKPKGGLKNRRVSWRTGHEVYHSAYCLL